MRSSNQVSPRKKTRWPLILAVNGAILFVVAISTARETYRRWQVDQEVSGLQAQVASLEQKKLDLTNVVNTLNSEDAVDKEARTHLGLQKPGERVFVVDVNGDDRLTWQDSSALAATSSPLAYVSNRSNPEKWFAYFFLPRVH